MLYVIFIVVFSFFCSLHLIYVRYSINVFCEGTTNACTKIGGARGRGRSYDAAMKAIASDSERVCPITVEFIAIMRRSISRRPYRHKYTLAQQRRVQMVRLWSKVVHICNDHTHTRPVHRAQCTHQCENAKFMTPTRILTYPLRFSVR